MRVLPALFGVSPGRKSAPARPHPELESMIGDLVDALVSAHFPQLRGLQIQFRAASRDLDSVFLETDVEGVFRSRKKRTYIVYVNDVLRHSSPGEEAIEAILVHELTHLDDYVGMSGFELIQLYRKINRDTAFQVSYERQTDTRALELGFAEGLKAYRTWLYERIRDPAALESKKRTYFTPDEIDRWLEERRRAAPPS